MTPGDETGLVTEAARRAADVVDGPTYLYDLAHLDGHVAGIRRALPTGTELLYAVKANPDPRLLAVLARHVDGWEIASGGELAHVQHLLPDAALSFAGPGKTDVELTAALAAGVHRFHVESAHELRRLDVLARATGTRAAVLLRVNLPVLPSVPAVLSMGGRPSQFGMEPTEADRCAHTIATGCLDGIELRGVHAHLASGLDAPDCVALAGTVLRWAAEFGARHGLPIPEVDVGGGMAVDYHRPTDRFDWVRYGHGLADVRRATPAATVVRVEPGRSMSAYSGWYATPVLDLKQSGGRWFAIVAGGTHHLRTPAAKGHDQPLTVLPTPGWDRPWARPEAAGPVTVVGQLCTPKDVLARDVPVSSIRVGDVVVCAMAGAYALNISHQDFLMHPPPAVRYL